MHFCRLFIIIIQELGSAAMKILRRRLNIANFFGYDKRFIEVKTSKKKVQVRIIFRSLEVGDALIVKSKAATQVNWNFRSFYKINSSQASKELPFSHD